MVDVVVLGFALVVALALRGGEDDRANVVNAGLRGSLPPAGQTMPDLRSIKGVEPPIPTTASLRGGPVAIIATCLQCRSGDIFGGYLSRLDADDRPEGSRIIVVGWEGDLDAWRTRHGLPADGGPAGLELHAATTDAAASELRGTFGIGERAGYEESGVAYLYDPRGRWRSTYFLGQLNRDDIRHDLEQLEDR